MRGNNRGNVAVCGRFAERKGSGAVVARRRIEIVFGDPDISHQVNGQGPRVGKPGGGSSAVDPGICTRSAGKRHPIADDRIVVGARVVPVTSLVDGITPWVGEIAKMADKVGR